MPLTNHSPKALRFVFAACAATQSSPLNPTQRAAIIVAPHDPQWVPTVEELPHSWAVVAAWHAGVQEASRPRGSVQQQRLVFMRRAAAQTPEKD